MSDTSFRDPDAFIDNLLPNTDGENNYQEDEIETEIEESQEDDDTTPEEKAEDQNETEDETEEEVEESEDESTDEPKGFEKRFKDTQSALTKEHQKVIDLEKRLSEVENAQSKEPEPQSEPAYTKEQFAKDFAEDPEAAINKQNASLREEVIAEVTTKLKQEKFLAEEHITREEFSDYDDVVNQQFSDDVAANSALRDQWIKDGGTPKAAYKLAKRIAQSKAFLDDPEAVRKALRKEIEEEMKSKKSKAPSSTETLAGDSSKKSSKKSKQEHKGTDTESVLALIGATQFAS